MTRLGALTARNMLLNRAVIYGMLEGEPLIRFTVWTGHTSGVQVEIKKALRDDSIFFKRVAYNERPNPKCRYTILAGGKHGSNSLYAFGLRMISGSAFFSITAKIRSLSC